MIDKNKNWKLDMENYLKEKKNDWEEQQAEKRQQEADALVEKEAGQEEG